MIYGNVIEPLEEVEGSLCVIEVVADELGTKPVDEKKPDLVYGHLRRLFYGRLKKPHSVFVHR